MKVETVTKRCSSAIILEICLISLSIVMIIFGVILAVETEPFVSIPLLGLALLFFLIAIGFILYDIGRGKDAIKYDYDTGDIVFYLDRTVTIKKNINEISEVLQDRNYSAVGKTFYYRINVVLENGKSFSIDQVEADSKFLKIWEVYRKKREEKKKDLD